MFVGLLLRAFVACRSPHRFELVLKDPQVIGMRRTAQVLMGRALQLLGDGRDVKAALWSALAALAAESNIISLAQLRKADSQTTAAIIKAFSNNAIFREVRPLNDVRRTCDCSVFSDFFTTTLVRVTPAVVSVVHQQHCWA